MNRRVDYCAYAFRSGLSLPGIRDRLNEEGRRSWRDRDSDRFGEYIASVTWPSLDEKVRYRILVEEDGYVFEVFCESEEPDFEEKWQKVHAYATETVLPLLGARDIQPTEPND